MNKKKLFGAFLALTALVGVSACGGKKTESTKSPTVSSQTEAVASSKASQSSVSTPNSSVNPTPSSSSTSSAPAPTKTTPQPTTPVDPDANFTTVLNQDFTDVTAIGDKTDGATMYLDSSAKGSAVVEGDTKYAKITGNSSDTTLYLTTSGLDNGKIKMSFDFSLGGVQGSWTLFQLYGTSETVVEPAEVFGFRTAKDNTSKVTYIGYRTDKGQPTPTGFSSQLAYDGNANTWFHTELLLDLGTGTGNVVVTKAGTSYEASFTQAISEIKALKFMAKSQKNVCVDNVVVKHELGDFATVKAQKLVKLENLYNSYDLTKYTTNGATLTAKYNETKAGVEAATDFDKLNEAYNKGVAEIKAIKSDAEIAAENLANAKTSAIAEVRAEYDRLDSEYNYTEAERTELDSARDSSIEAINDAQTIEEIPELITAAKALLASITHTGTGSEVVKMTYSFDATTLTAAADKEKCTQDEFGTTVTMTGSVTKRVSTSSGKVYAIELAKQNGGTLSFVATANATLTLTIGSSSGANTSYFVVLADDQRVEAATVSGGAVKDTTDATYVVVTGTKYAENVVTYTLEKGKTYTLCTMAGADVTISGRTARIVTMNIA